MKSMKFEKILATTTLTGTLLAGCSTPDQPPTPSPSPTPSVSESSAPLLFQKTPDDFSVTDCVRDVHSWAVHIDANPENKNRENIRDHTVGITAGHETGQPTLLAGATVRNLGDFAFRIATSADIPGVSTVVNVKEDTYSRVLRAGEGYDAVFSLHLGRDGSAYAQIDCLPEHGFYGDKTPTPLLPPTPPSQSPGIPAGRDDTVDA
jgi:hypothetical protein